MSANDSSTSADDLIAYLSTAPLETTVGGPIEEYCERYLVTERERPVFERFLLSTSTGNRSAALAALIWCGKFNGYEADCLLLHFNARTGLGPQEEFDAISYLRNLRDAGSAAAFRILEHLDRDVYVKDLYGDD